MRLVSLSIVACAAGLAVTTAAALARPDVVLHLSGAMVEKAANGSVRLTPIDASTKLKTGEIVQYTISAYNKGSDPALHLAPVGKIPNGTAYVAGSALNGTAKLEFSVDGGKTWSAKPMVTVQVASGPQTKPADPSSFTAIRWTNDKPLAPKGSARFSYEVRVK